MSGAFFVVFNWNVCQKCEKVGIMKDMVGIIVERVGIMTDLVGIRLQKVGIIFLK